MVPFVEKIQNIPYQHSRDTQSTEHDFTLCWSIGPIGHVMS